MSELVWLRGKIYCTKYTMCNGMFDHWLRRTIENLCHSIVSDGCFSKIGILCKMRSSIQDSTSLFACVTRYIRRCQWILTRNEWWYTFTLANFRGDEGSGRVGRQGQGLSSHQFCSGSPQSTMAGIQRFNQSVNKEVPPKPNPFPTC